MDPQIIAYGLCSMVGHRPQTTVNTKMTIITHRIDTVL